MYKFPLVLAAAACTAPVLATPVTAQPVSQVLLRDSDGIVISIIDVIDYPTVGTTDGVVPGEVYYTLGGVRTDVVVATGDLSSGPSVLEGGPLVLDGVDLTQAGGSGLVIQIGNASYRVESAGQAVWLRDIATGQRLALEQHIAPVTPDSVGLKVNPVAFGLD